MGRLLLGAMGVALVVAVARRWAGSASSLKLFPRGIGTWINEHIARGLASLLVGAALPGEDLAPLIRFEQPWTQFTALFVLGGSSALIVWLYRREGSAPTRYKMLLAGLRISLVVLAMLMLSEMILSVERTGLPFVVVMVDDSASGQVVDQYDDPKLQAKADWPWRSSPEAAARPIAWRSPRDGSRRTTARFSASSSSSTRSSSTGFRPPRNRSPISTSPPISSRPSRP